MKTIAGYVIIAACAAGLLGLAEFETQRRLAAAEALFIDHVRDEAHVDIRPAASALTHIYENLRTLAALPSVRETDRHGSSLVGDTRETFQQIYNNLASAVAVSEVYVLPADFDPLRIDPVTGKPEEPIVMFDELIVDAAARQSPEVQAALTPERMEEVEIHEYMEFQKQIAWLKQAYPQRSLIKDMSVPIIGSHSLITCDNTDFVHTGNDADRMGILFSVPFYKNDGAFGGVVAGIIRDNALKAALPRSDMALYNDAYGYSVGTPADMRADPAFIFSESLPIAVNDPKGSWSVWVGRKRAEFMASPDARSAKAFRLYGSAIILILAGMLMLFCRNWAKDQTRIQRQNEELERKVIERTEEIAVMADRDALTGLANRAAMNRQIDAIASDPSLADSAFALACIDIDDFKAINDSLGHAAGDEFLRRIAGRLSNAVGAEGLAARWGGDEFVLIHCGTSTTEAAASLASRIEGEIRKPMSLGGETIRPRASIGLVLNGQHGSDPKDLMRKADLALYAAKAAKASSWRLFEPDMEAAFERRRWLEVELSAALARGDIEAYFQPIISVDDSRVIGFEALARWTHPERGAIPPDQFIPVAESANLIADLGAKILREACAAAASWPSEMTIAVNLSGHQLRRPSLALHVMNALAAAGLPAHRLELEMTETVLMSDEPEVHANLNAFREAGIKISLDDFGTGYSSLSYLQTFPIDSIKIDRSFVNNLGVTPQAEAIISAVGVLSQKLGVPTIAEGVETPAQLELLRQHGCNRAQGWLFGKAMPQSEIAEFLANAAARVAA